MGGWHFHQRHIRLLTALAAATIVWCPVRWAPVLPLALLVFFASFVVPLSKIAVLVLLLVTVQKGSAWRRRDRTLLYRVTEVVGAWSMVDIFLVGILVALVNLDALASVRPGVGAIFFGAAVVLTMLAAMSFDPRLIWDHAERGEDRAESVRHQ